jgi:ribosomal protein S12 methylthiotransferase accessory factor YcaO
MTNNINVAAVLCVAVDSFDNAPLYGMGASLYSEHAVERAVTELMQSYWLRKSMNSEEKKESHALLENQYRNLQNYPEHLRCTKLDLKNSITNNNFNLKEFSSLPSLMGSVSVISQVDILQNKIAQQGLEIFYCLLRQAEDTGVTVVHTIIPGLEYFWASAYGNVIAPFKRINAQMCSLE